MAYSFCREHCYLFQLNASDLETSVFAHYSKMSIKDAKWNVKSQDNLLTETLHSEVMLQKAHTSSSENHFQPSCFAPFSTAWYGSLEMNNLELKRTSWLNWHQNFNSNFNHAPTQNKIASFRPDCMFKNHHNWPSTILLSLCCLRFWDLSSLWILNTFGNKYQAWLLVRHLV